jgi:hypothetical protein
MEYDDSQGEISREGIESNDPKVHAMRPDCPHCHPPFPTCCSPSRDILFWETRLHLSDILNERRRQSRENRSQISEERTQASALVGSIYSPREARQGELG